MTQLLPKYNESAYIFKAFLKYFLKNDSAYFELPGQESQVFESVGMRLFTVEKCGWMGKKIGSNQTPDSIVCFLPYRETT